MRTCETHTSADIVYDKPIAFAAAAAAAAATAAAATTAAAAAAATAAIPASPWKAAFQAAWFPGWPPLQPWEAAYPPP